MFKALPLRAAILAVFCFLACTSSFPDEKKFSTMDRDFARTALHEIQDDLLNHYYDPKFHGVDINAVFKKADDRIIASDGLNHALSEIAQALAELNDSHTFFIPPPRPYIHDYGWRMEFFGDQGAFITAVRPGSDAEQKGIKPGDQILTLNGYPVQRDYFWKMEYVYWALRPQDSLRLQLRSPNGAVREVVPAAYFRPTHKVADLTGNEIWELVREGENDEHSRRIRFADRGKDVLILKIPEFTFYPDQADGILNKVRSHDAVVIDLRGNPGGYEESLTKLLGGFFDHEVKIADRTGRKNNMKPSIAKPHGHPYTGKVFVLVDSKSASCSELFARVMQLEHRGMVIGDRSSGSVMEAMHYDHKVGAETIVPFGASITSADMIMTDGKSLEHVGVIPDTLMLPTGADLAAGRDPVLAYAVQQAGGQISAEEAGKLFPIEWPNH